MDLSKLSLGQRVLVSTSLRLTPQEVAEYLEAVGDTQPLYVQKGIVPPTALAARVIRALVDHLALPAGVTHIAQDLELLAPCPTGAVLTLDSHVVRNSVRGGWRFLGMSFEVRQPPDTMVLRGTSTVLAPVGQ